VAVWPEDYDEQTRRKLLARVPAGRAGEPADIAACVHFLLAEGDYITGTVIPVDGGRHVV
jgi:NAD(P)-dependent dehydrogenase (short-subunit alcohol dehydrogenase family)